MAKKPKDRVGTCGVCLHEFKVRQKDGVWVVGKHGLRRDHDGNGGLLEWYCAGAEQPPHEHSAEVMVAEVGRLRAKVSELEEKLARYEAGPPTLSLADGESRYEMVGRFRFCVLDYIDIGPDHPRFHSELDHKITMTKMFIRDRLLLISRLETMVANWTRKAIPGADAPSVEG